MSNEECFQFAINHKDTNSSWNFDEISARNDFYNTFINEFSEKEYLNKSEALSIPDIVHVSLYNYSSDISRIADVYPQHFYDESLYQEILDFVNSEYRRRPMMNKEKLRYAILKEISNGNTPLTDDDFPVTPTEFDEAVRFLTRENYLQGIEYSDNRPHIYMIGPMLTEKGEKYLEENSVWSKAYRGLKEVKEFIGI
ncbi:YjcQ family protein [Bacillus sp. V2I10]|uniref:YjcQ family protein n=1 Tax=Bacillus sp. V2I10 TaxID=3042276 RepID=UPI00278384D1|nr:YjcQ family protein [Bacillus sp. V2I10]MDQ0860023.1 hypothetical protein [Bacillus sp. V2I10]